MTFGDSFLAYIQRQEYLANQQFESNEVEYSFELLYNRIHDAYVTEEERWEETCQRLSSSP